LGGEVPLTEIVARLPRSRGAIVALSAVVALVGLAHVDSRARVASAPSPKITSSLATLLISWTQTADGIAILWP
jgi:hypothetical protein